MTNTRSVLDLEKLQTFSKSLASAAWIRKVVCLLICRVVSWLQMATFEHPFEHQLFTMLGKRLGRGAHAEYNALIQRIVSFANAYPKSLL